MGKKNQQKPKEPRKPSQRTVIDDEKLLKIMKKLTTKDDWDDFFTCRGLEASFERFADWSLLKSLLPRCITTHTSYFATSRKQRGKPDKTRAELRILVPACGNSLLSEHLYDAGFKSITNLDFSGSVISDMWKRNKKDRPEMQWVVSDMTKTGICDENFDAIVDKGGLTTLMEPQNDPKSCNLYIYEVKRLLKFGGKYICVTTAETHVLDLLFLTFRFGWKTSVHGFPQDPRGSASKPKQKPFIVVAEKDHPTTTVSDISLIWEKPYDDGQVRNLHEALEMESRARADYTSGAVIEYSLVDLKLGARGPISVYEPGRIIKVVLGDSASKVSYHSILLDAKQDSGFLANHYVVHILPQLQVSGWLYASEEGQWDIVERCNTARLLLVFLDDNHSKISMEDTCAEVVRLSKYLTPGYVDEYRVLQIRHLAADDGFKRKIVHEVTSDKMGEIGVDDTTYTAIKGKKFRSLSIENPANVVMTYEAVLSTEESTGTSSEAEQASSGEIEVAHNFLGSQYHDGIIAGALLITQYLILYDSCVGVKKVVIFGLGAGLLPMFMKTNCPSLKIEVVESDPILLDVARDYFAFKEDELLKVHNSGGLEFLETIANKAEEEKVGIIVIDVASDDISSSDLICPHNSFLEPAFLLLARESLSKQGLFVINLVTPSIPARDEALSSLKSVFGNIFFLVLEIDIVNEVIFAMKSDVQTFKEEQFCEAHYHLAMTLNTVKEPWSHIALELANSVRPLILM